MEGTNQRQLALSYALLMYMVGIVLLITLIPFQFHIPQQISSIWEIYLNDSITNIFLFLPLGFLFQLSRRNHNDTLCVGALGFGLLVSVVIEITQVFLLWRYTSAIDVVTNGLGAWVGALMLQDTKKIDYTDREEGKTGKSAALTPFLAFDLCLALIIKKLLRNIFNKFIR